MADIDLSSIRTTEDIINVLSVLYFNLNEIERTYYDMFLNETPMDVTFQRYDDLGVLREITLPNRAKDRQDVLTGSGDPNGAVSASVGALYLDTTNYDLYFKSSGSDSQGWILVWSKINLVAGTDFLSPTGNAAQLTNLNMSNAGSGILSVIRGGTGSANITGIIRGNGTSAMSAAEDGVDYLGPSSMVGIVAFYPINNIPVGWLRCDGSAYSRSTYARLFSKIGTTYGSGDGSTTFNVPSLYNHFIRCWDGTSAFNTVQQDQVGVHNHGLSGNVGSESSHTHGAGTLNHKHSIPVTKTSTGADPGDTTPHRWNDGDHAWRDISAPDTGGAKNWTGNTAGGSAHTHSLNGLTTQNNIPASGTETRVLNKMMVPVIKF